MLTILICYCLPCTPHIQQYDSTLIVHRGISGYPYFNGTPITLQYFCSFDMCDKLYNVGNFIIYSLLSVIRDVVTDNVTAKYLSLISLATVYKACQTFSSLWVSLCPSFSWSN
jgi:hypothetical protein